MIKGIITAIVTPMLNSGEIDFIAFDRLIEFQIANGVSGLVVVGSTGEASNLDNDEKIKLIKHMIEVVKGRVRIIVGTSCSGMHITVKFIEILNTISGVDCILAPTPSYVKPTQEGLYQYFAALTQMSHLPIILYNVPNRTACNLEDTTILKLAHDFKNIVGLKDATGDIARCCYLLKYKPTDFILLSGDDATALAFILCGGDGVISVISNLVPKQLSQMSKFIFDGNFSKAIELNNQVLELQSLMFMETNPIPIKWALCNVGLINTPQLRLPLTILTKGLQEMIKPVLSKIVSIESYAS